MVKADTIPVPLETLKKALKALEHLEVSRFAAVPAEIHIRDVVDIIRVVEPHSKQVAEELWECINYVTQNKLANPCTEENTVHDRVNDQSIKQAEQ